ncbi:MAG: hypothetical protein J5U19_15305 [Candidatus Methanoperedens sp.]|nr:hypothetical protein [Candidatus Methanoperedens sp.]
MGDLNADCDYFKENSQSPLRSSDYYWIINNSIDTTTKSTDCTYIGLSGATGILIERKRSAG